MDLTMIIILSWKTLVEELEGQFTCLAKDTKKCKAFSVPIEKEVARINTKGNETTKTIS